MYRTDRYSFYLLLLPALLLHSCRTNASQSSTGFASLLVGSVSLTAEVAAGVGGNVAAGIGNSNVAVGIGGNLHFLRSCNAAHAAPDCTGPGRQDEVLRVGHRHCQARQVRIQCLPIPPRVVQRVAHFSTLPLDPLLVSSRAWRASCAPTSRPAASRCHSRPLRAPRRLRGAQSPLQLE